MILTDTVTLDDAAVKFTREGFLTAPVRAARTGIQTYRADEIGLTDRPAGEMVRVYRAPEEVFAVDSLRSFSMIDATIDHPSNMIDAKNWRDLAVGSVGENVLRDGEFMVLPLILKDAEAIDAWKGGKKQLSVGYECEIVLGDGVTPTGEQYAARQTTIRANHLALCNVARGGPSLRIGDSTVPLKTITYDGVPIADVSEAAEAVINKVSGQLAAAIMAKGAAEAKVATLTTDSAAKDAKIATLEQAVKDAAVTPAQMRDAAKAYATTLAQAKALAPTLTIGDDADTASVKKAVVTAKLGDAAKGWTDAQIDISFATMAAGVKVADASTDPLASIIGDGLQSVGDAQTKADAAYAKRRQDLADAWKTPAATH